VYNFCVAIDDALMRITHVIRAVRSHPEDTSACCAHMSCLFVTACVRHDLMVH
jgi:hypothetical protein